MQEFDFGRCGGVATGSLLRRQIVKNVICVPQPRAGFLIDERHDSGKRRGRRRCSADADKAIGRQAAWQVSSWLYSEGSEVGLAHDVKAVFESGARKQRNIGLVAHAILGHTGTGLPRRLAVASAAHGIAILRDATAGAAAAADDIETASTTEAVACPLRGTGLIPGCLGDIAQSRSPCRWVVGGTPATRGGGRSLIEIRAADRDVVWSGCGAADCQSAGGCGRGVEVIAAGQAAVARRNHDGNALGRRLLPTARCKRRCPRCRARLRSRRSFRSSPAQDCCQRCKAQRDRTPRDVDVVCAETRSMVAFGATALRTTKRRARLLARLRR